MRASSSATRTRTARFSIEACVEERVSGLETMDDLLHWGWLLFGNDKMNARPATFVAFEPHPSAVRFDDFLDDRQAEPRPAVTRLSRRAEEALEHAVLQRIGDAGAVVRDDEMHAAAGARPGGANGDRD